MSNQQISIILETISFFFVGLDLYGRERLAKVHSNILLTSEKTIQLIDFIRESGWSSKKSMALMNIAYSLTAFLAAFGFSNFVYTAGLKDWNFNTVISSWISFFLAAITFANWKLEISSKISVYLIGVLLISCAITLFLVPNKGPYFVFDIAGFLLIITFSLGFILLGILISVSILLFAFLFLLWILKNAFYLFKRVLDITKFEGLLLIIGTLLFIFSKYLQLFSQ